MKVTPLTPIHRDLGARMMPFAGYEMPVSYTSINDEHLAVRKSVGLFDVSHMGQFILKGDNALNVLQRLTSNDASKLSVGQAQYTCLPNTEGGIIDDLLVYKIEETSYMLVVNASNIEKDYSWIESNLSLDTTLENISDSMALLALQGPKAIDVLQKLTDVQVDQIPYYYFAHGTVAGIDNVIISATGYTGSGGFELYIPNDSAATLWDQLLYAGKDDNIMPVGLGARDTLRLEMGFCLYGNDIDDSTSPIEAGLSWITKLGKEEAFSSKEIFKAQKENGIDKKLVGFILEDKRVPRQGYEIVDAEGTSIGTVTSGTMSPSLDKPIGMGYVQKTASKRGQQIFIKIRKKTFPATIVKLPFYKE